MKGNPANKLDAISEWLMIILIALLPFHAFMKTWFTSLFTDSTVDFLSTGSFVIGMWKEIIIVLLGVVWLINLILRRKWPFTWMPADIFIGIFLGINLIYAVIAEDKTAVLWGLKTNCALFVLYFIARSTKFRILTHAKTLLLLLGTTIIVNIVAWLQYLLPPSAWLIFGYTPYVSSYVDNKPLPFYHGIGEKFEIIRLNSTLSGPNQLGAYLTAVLLLLLTFLLCKQKYLNTLWRKALFWTTLLSTTLIILFTFSRAALIGLVAGGAVLLFVKWDIKQKILLLAGSIAIVVFILTLWGTISPQSFDTYIIHGASTSERIEKWEEGWHIVSEHPLGLGLGQAGPVSRRLYGEEQGIISENWYLQIAEETGVVSVLFILCGFLYLLKHFYEYAQLATTKLHSQLALGMFAALISIMLNGLFLHTWDDSTLAYIFCIMSGFMMYHYDVLLHTTTTLRSKALQALLHYVKK